MRRALLLLLLLSGLMVSPPGVFADGEDPPIRFGVEAIDADGPFFEISLEPGESTERTVRFSNHGDVGTEATIYATDVYTIPGGGMGMRQIDEPATGPTEWLSFETEELELGAREAIDQTFTVSVPEDAEPGDYITAVVIQNSDPIEVGDDEQFNQTVRQGVAVSIDVPGPREPGLEIDDIEHSVSGERSIIVAGIENTGNAHLRPEGEFSLFDNRARLLAETSVSMDTVYAGTESTLEVRFESRLNPGEYVVSLQLEDPETGAEAMVDGRAFEVAGTAVAEEDTEADGGATGGVPGTTEDASPGVIGWIAAVLVMLSLLSLVAIVATMLVRRFGQRPEPPRPGMGSRRQPESQPLARPAEPASRQPRKPRPIRQLEPRKRAE